MRCMYRDSSGLAKLVAKPIRLVRTEEKSQGSIESSLLTICYELGYGKVFDLQAPCDRFPGG
jgi:hypothetical protein